MRTVTFRVLEGIDKGKIFRDIPTPLWIGREEGTQVRLNDERVSRYHAKVQADKDDLVLHDLESTNGTRVNNIVVTIRRLLPGDRVTVGRTQLLFGTDDEIRDHLTVRRSALDELSHTLAAHDLADELLAGADLDPSAADKLTVHGPASLAFGDHPLPPLPQKLSPSQAARLAEMLDFLHHHLSAATEDVRPSEDGLQVALDAVHWQRILSLQMILARYIRGVTEPDSLNG